LIGGALLTGYLLIGSKTSQPVSASFKNALIGDIGGTNVRFQLIRINKSGEFHELKKLGIYNP